MKTIVALIGKAGAGKDTIADILCQQHPEWNEIISCTTRPRREGEVEGIDYYYLTEEEFSIKLYNDEFLEMSFFNGWCYGTPKSSIKEGINIGVFDPTGYEQLRDNIDPLEFDVYGFYIDTNDKERLIRQLNREVDPNVEEIIRRYSADEKDFSDIEELGLWSTINNTKSDLSSSITFIEGILHDVGAI